MLQIPDEIKELLHRDSCQKNIRIHFPNGERSDICNNLIVKDSVSFTESLCSQNTLKFGLCESPMFECEVVGVGNIKGATIEVNCEIYCDSSVTGAIWQNDLMAYVYQIPYGTFIVREAKRQADMNHRKIVAYSHIYNSLQNTISEKTTLSAHYACRLRNSNTDYNTYIEELIYGTYPLLFNEQLYPNTKKYLRNQQSVSSDNGIGTFYLNGQNMHIRLIDNTRQIIRSNDEIYVANWGELERNSDAEISKRLEEIYCVFDETFPDAKDYFGNPFSIRDFFNNFQRGLYTRSFISVGGSGNPVYFNETDEKQVLFGEIYDVIDFITSITLSVDDTAFSESCQYISEDAYFYTINYSDISLIPWALPRKADSKTTWSGTTITGYSAREAFFKLKIIDIVNAYAEINGQFWTYRRGISDRINIKQQFGLTPSQTLYPGSSVYPEGVTGGKLLPNDYQSCWYEDDYTKPWGAIYISYKDTNNKDAVYIYYLSGFSSDDDASTYLTYYLDNNYIIQQQLWTTQQLETVCQGIVSSIEGVTYMPVEFVGRGLPYVEAGDTFEILTASNDSITTIVLNRTVSGEQVLTDSYKSVS